jgi:hypothetical protein
MNGFRIFCTVRTSIAANEARKRFQAKACPGLDPGACPGLDPGWRAGSRQENASTRESAAPFRFYRSGKGQQAGEAEKSRKKAGAGK